MFKGHIFFCRRTSGFLPAFGHYKKKLAMIIVELGFLLYIGTSFGPMLRSGPIAWSTSSTMSNFLRIHQARFHSGCTSSQYHQQRRREFLFIHLLTNICCHLSFDLIQSECCEVDSLDCLICISLMSKDMSLVASRPFGFPQLRILCLALCPILHRVIRFSRFNLLEFFVYIWILVFYWM